MAQSTYKGHVEPVSKWSHYSNFTLNFQLWSLKKNSVDPGYVNPSLAGIKMNQACKRGYLYLRSHYPLNFTSIFMKFSRIICRS